MHAAVGGLVLKAHTRRTHAFAQLGLPCQVPEFVKALAAKEDLRQSKRAQRAQRSALENQRRSAMTPANDLARILHTPPISLEESLTAESLGVESWSDLDWDEWTKMVNEWENNLDAFSK